MKIKGYAVPFNSLGLVEDGYEFATAPAFYNMLRGTDEITLQVSEHGGDIVAARSDGSLHIGIDEFGLRFEADIGDSAMAMRVAGMVVRGMSFCSIEMDMQRSRIEPGHRCAGVDAQRILQASLNHIAIVSAGAAYKQTAVWPADQDLYRAPSRISDAAARWERGANLASVYAEMFDRNSHENVAARRMQSARLDACQAEHERFMASVPSGWMGGARYRTRG